VSLWVVGATTFLVTLVASPLVRNLLERHDLLDRPNARSSHTQPVPRGGGITVAAGLLGGGAAGALVGLPLPWALLAMALALAAVGFLDDRSGLPAAPRLTAQVVLGAVAGAVLGGPAAAVAGALVVPVVVNVVNFMDGINGMTSTTLAVWGASSAAAGLVHDSVPLAALGTMTAAGALGFLPWNAPRASMFLGDVGSYLFGGLVAGGILLAVDAGVPVWAVVAPLSVYLLDVFLTLARRALRRRPLMTAHREHVYQLLVGLGAAHLPVSLVAAGVALAVTVCWWTLPTAPATAATAVALTLYAAMPALLRHHQERHATRA